ncbi:COX15/CtaA family protein [Sphingorhabdus arenilitoris]|uniref:Heme A synthase n=1 Tax=Sphingorhabdus arenilitoris TaxID=1490041 RepID=A0ABV8RD49_9SPHN
MNDIAQNVNLKARPNALANWLFFVASLVFAMVVVGGITRLTESGLSITEWKPVTGALPPLNEADWLSEFEKYRTTTEYQQVNAGMSLADFKFIYFWEWAHRLLARLVGVAFALPFLWFLVKGAIPKGYIVRLVPLFLLGGLQGVIGWWMVVSGLADRTDVSHFRLATHLLLALFILASLVWTALDLKALAADRNAPRSRLTGFALIVIVILLIQLLFGAYVAGMNAGQVANTWPLMNDHFVPEGIEWTQGVVFAVLNDPFLVHFIHRWWAWVAVAALILMARRLKKMGARRISVAIHVAFGTQILLGISTVMSGVNITNFAITLAVLHQAVGALLVASVAWGAHRLGTAPGREPSIAGGGMAPGQVTAA